MPADPRAHLSQWRARARRTLRRRRRPLAAVLAGLGTLAALSALRAPEPTVDPQAASRPPLVAPGQVTVPITLSPPGLLRVLHVGQQVDLVAVGGDGPSTAHVVSAGARIVSVPDSGSAFSPTSSAVVLVAVDEADSLALLATSSRDTVTVLLRDPA